MLYFIYLFIYLFIYWWDWSLNSGLCTRKAGALPLEPHLQVIVLWLFWRWGPHELFIGTGLKPQSSDLSLPSS
jgi:hypothetical protein